MLLRLFIAVLIFLILRWLFLKLYEQYLRHKVQKENNKAQQPPPVYTPLDELEQKAHANSEERKHIRGETDKNQEQLTNIKQKLK